MRRRFPVKVILAIAALIILVSYAVHWWTTGRFVEDTDDAYVGGDVTVVGSKVAGYIDAVAVTDNQSVHRGDLLVHIDDRDYQAAVAKADAAVDVENASIANLGATARLQLSIIAQASAAVEAARAEARRSQLDNERYRDLSSRSAVSIESAQRAEADFQSAKAGTERATAAAEAARQQLNVIDTQKSKVMASLAQARAESSLAHLNLSYTRLVAPIDGVVGNRRARVGAWSAAGGPLVAVVPAHGLWVDANFKEDQLRRLRVGQAVSIRADVLPGRVFRGRIESLAPATGSQFSILPPENATGNFTKIVQRVPVRVALEGRDGDLDVLRPGLSVTATVNTKAP
jgi:membrane fusion protein (multidrug efflux system)